MNADFILLLHIRVSHVFSGHFRTAYMHNTNMYAIKNSYKQLEEKHVLLIKKCITGRKSANLEGEKILQRMKRLYC